MSPTALRQVGDQVEVEALDQLIGEPIGRIGVVAVIHPNHRNVRSLTRHHVQDNRFEGTKVGRDDRALALLQGPANQCIRVVA